MFTEDLAVFFNSAEHAVNALYNGVTTIQVIFDRAYLSQLGIAGTNPVALCAASSVAADPTGKALVINSVNYLIRGFEPQDDGAVVLLQLEKQ